MVIRICGLENESNTPHTGKQDSTEKTDPVDTLMVISPNHRNSKLHCSIQMARYHFSHSSIFLIQHSS
jgi:hypothetical protein